MDSMLPPERSVSSLSWVLEDVGRARMEREGYGTRGRPIKGAVPARLDDVIDGTGASTRGRRVTWHLYRLLGYFLTGSVGEHPVKNS